MPSKILKWKQQVMSDNSRYWICYYKNYPLYIDDCSPNYFTFERKLYPINRMPNIIKYIDTISKE